MSLERQRKIELLVRKNEGKREHPYYLTELAHVLKQPINEGDLIDLETSDDLFSKFDKGALRDESDGALRRTWPSEPNSSWIRVCFSLAERLGDEPVALFVGPYKVCGAIRTRAEYPLLNALSVLAFDRDTLSLLSLSSDSGLYVDLFEEKSTWWVELKVWGEWRSQAQECLIEELDRVRLRR